MSISCSPSSPIPSPWPSNPRLDVNNRWIHAAHQDKAQAKAHQDKAQAKAIQDKVQAEALQDKVQAKAHQDKVQAKAYRLFATLMQRLIISDLYLH